MRAVVLAGGKGTRLRPYTTVFPKPMVPVGEVPILEILLRKLKTEGFTHVTLSVGYLAELIRAYFDQPRAALEGMTLDYVYEQEPTGTAGALRLVEGLTDTFMLMNGDVLTTMSMTKLLAHHRSTGATLTIATHERNVEVNLGVLDHDDTGRVIDYTEKPTLTYRASMGVYVVEPEAIQYVPEGYFDFPDLVRALLDAGRPVMGYPSDDFWLDVGRPEDYERAQQEFDARREAFGFE